ncbi:thioredoxin-like protein [Dunaliella salina]|uniref:Thioredoxin-like protein n=1 Tax=Dunaliella salina TaxID=3046 RepID=A0ABQ7GPP7_DUNSA|nr:thioredoxin-like protein [Dunaliella salina]|eukprot:KAF5836526.1 thioredoxin-like protein [Dunaliella salina]
MGNLLAHKAPRCFPWSGDIGSHEQARLNPCPCKTHQSAIKVNGEQLEAEIAGRDRHLIVDFYATWCGPCVLLAQELEKAAEQLGDEVRVLKLDVDENPQLSSALKIEGLPTIVFVPKAGDKPALRTEGLYPADQLVQIVREL